ncbi:transmembrane protease serine 2-like [Oppia nitens]|uniref:transmembrane protease serine 2-like n=1 Tax=Oppia nitens TaxID=1686743 RepID=UPI0023DB73F5|nr:transmembrane protease serine 2-like [Oppia nitens]
MNFLALLYINNGTEYLSHCSAIILNREWLLTAAHCIYCPSNETGCPLNLWILAGLTEGLVYVDNNWDSIAKYPVIGQYPHPDADWAANSSRNDLALLRVSPWMPIGGQLINSVCLPKSGILNTRPEYAMMSGWGFIDRQGSDSDWAHGIAYTRIKPADPDVDAADDRLLIMSYIDPIGTGGYVCAGDSGGPLVQYVNGRAVLIGVHAGSADPPDYHGDCASNTTEAHMGWTRISMYMDWLVDVIHNSTGDGGGGGGGDDVNNDDKSKLL